MAYVVKDFQSALLLHRIFIVSRQSQLKLLLDYVYTGEICASKTMMEEFEYCLKEMGILGTHSLACSNEIITPVPADMAPLLNTVQLPCSLQTSSIPTNMSTNPRASENAILPLESVENKTFASNLSNSGDNISEEETGSWSNTIMDGGKFPRMIHVDVYSSRKQKKTIRSF